MSRPTAYADPCVPIPPRGPGVARILAGDVVVLLPARGRVILVPVNLPREPDAPA